MASIDNAVWAHRARLTAFFVLTTMILVMASERAYWTLGGLSVDTLVVTPLAYLIPTAAMLWTLARSRAQRITQVVLGGAIYAFVVEGVLTPVVFEDGPLPVLALLFVGWHGLVAVVGFWYLTHLWLVGRQRRLLSLSAVFFGIYWGLWSMTWTLPEAVGPGPADIGVGASAFTPPEFLWYSLTVGAIVAVAHWLLGFVWPKTLTPGRRTGIAIALIAALYHAATVLPTVPWAPLKLAVLLGGVWWLMSQNPEGDRPNIFSRLHGRVIARDAALLLLAPLTASAVYWMVWSIDPSDQFVGGMSAVITFSQVIAGGVALAWAAIKVLRSGSQDEDRPSTSPAHLV